MALLAEQLVDEWMNRRGFFTLRGIKEGVSEIDLLGVKLTNGQLEGWHVEVQVSFRPVSYISKLSKESIAALGAKSASSAIARTPAVLEASVQEWVHKKFDAKQKLKMRELCWKSLTWSRKFVHGAVKDQAELSLIGSQCIELIPFEAVLEELCGHPVGELFGGAGTDIAEIIRFYSKKVKPLHVQSWSKATQRGDRGQCG